MSQPGKSVNIFSQILPRKRKREDDTDDEEEDGDGEGVDLTGAAIVKMARLSESITSVRTRKRKISFSDEKSTQQNVRATPSKATNGGSSLKSPTEVIGTTPMKIITPRKFIEESPCKRVSFSGAHLSATPRRSESFIAKGILKTPSKDLDTSADDGFCKPTMTPSRATARTLNYTPKKSPAASRSFSSPGGRRDISSPGGRQAIRMLRVCNEPVISNKSPAKSIDNSLHNQEVNHFTPIKQMLEDEEPTSPIISSNKKKRRILQDSLSSETSGHHGFPTPSPGMLSRINKVEDTMKKMIGLLPPDDSFNEMLKNKKEDSSDKKLNSSITSERDLSKHKRSSRNSFKQTLFEQESSEVKVSDIPAATTSRVSFEVSSESIESKFTNKEQEQRDAPEKASKNVSTNSNLAVPTFDDEPNEVRRTSPRKNAGSKRRPSTMLGDELTEYFSPKSSKRAVKVRQDIQDNLAIANALLAKSPSKSARKRVGGRSLQFDEDKTPVKTSMVKASCDKDAGASAIEDHNNDIVPIKETEINYIKQVKNSDILPKVRVKFLYL